MDFSTLQRERWRGTGRNAIATIVTLADRVRIVANNAVVIASLKEQHHPITRAIDTGKGEDFTDWRPQIVHSPPPEVCVAISKLCRLPLPLVPWYSCETLPLC